MSAITVNQLSELIQKSLDDESDKDVSPKEARKRQADKMAQAINLFIVGRQTVVTGTSVSGGAVTGTGIIQ